MENFPRPDRDFDRKFASQMQISACINLTCCVKHGVGGQVRSGKHASRKQQSVDPPSELENSPHVDGRGLRKPHQNAPEAEVLEHKLHA
jgi:hypothetical protein